MNEAEKRILSPQEIQHVVSFFEILIRLDQQQIAKRVSQRPNKKERTQ